MNTEFYIDPVFIDFAYVVAAVFFIIGLKYLTNPKTAVRARKPGALGMFIAILATFLAKAPDYELIIAGLVIGASIGAIAAIKATISAMPQMVALLNGFGGAASVLVAGCGPVAYHKSLVYQCFLDRSWYFFHPRDSNPRRRYTGRYFPAQFLLGPGSCSHWFCPCQ